MDYIVGFFFGYFLKNFFSWLNDFILLKDKKKDLEDWDWIR